MTDYDNEYYRCLNKEKLIKNRLNMRSENIKNSLSNTDLDNQIKNTIEEFGNMIKNLKNFTQEGAISNQELKRRTDNIKEFDDIFLQFKKQTEINQIKLNVKKISKKNLEFFSYNKTHQSKYFSNKSISFNR